jgi:group I intron endonuclease
MGYIYKLENKINGKIYIGQTIRQIEKRLNEHKTGKSRRCVAIYNAIKFHGWDNFEKDWYECPDEDLNFDEELLVREMGTLSPGGYNLRDGGGSNGKHSEESKQRMGEANRGEKSVWYGKTHTDATKQKISEAQRGDKNHMYGKNVEKNPMYGKRHSKETKQKIREARLGDTHAVETKKKISEALLSEKNHKSKRVYQYDLEVNFIGSFGSSREAGRQLLKAGSSIRACARGELKTAHGFKWSYNPPSN